MINTKTLMLAAMTALSLGAGAAMAQDSASGFPPGSPELLQPNQRSPAVWPGYATGNQIHASRTPTANDPNAVQSGGADIQDTAPPGLLGGGG